MIRSIRSSSCLYVLRILWGRHGWCKKNVGIIFLFCVSWSWRMIKKMAFRDAEELSNLIMVDVNNRTSNCWHALYYCTKKKCAVYFSINSFCRQQSANHGGAHDHRGWFEGSGENQWCWSWWSSQRLTNRWVQWRRCDPKRERGGPFKQYLSPGPCCGTFGKSQVVLERHYVSNGSEKLDDSACRASLCLQELMYLSSFFTKSFWLNSNRLGVNDGLMSNSHDRTTSLSSASLPRNEPHRVTGRANICGIKYWKWPAPLREPGGVSWR